AILAWAVFDRISLKRRTDPGGPPVSIGGWGEEVAALRGGGPGFFPLGVVFPPPRYRVPGLGNPALGCLKGNCAPADGQGLTAAEVKRLTAPDIRARKGGTPIVALPSYHAHTARIVDRHCDVILVGDSLGMVMHGLETTVPVTLDMMILQGLAVMRGSRQALV